MDDARVESVARLPAPALRVAIDGYLGYRLDGFDPGLHRGLPSRHLTFIVSIGPPIDVVAEPGGAPPGSYGAVLAGLQAAPALISHRGAQEGVAIELTPVGCRLLCGMPASELWSTSLEADEVLGAHARELRERLHESADWEARFAACDDVLCRLLSERVPVPSPLLGAWDLLVRSGGGAQVREVASAVGWSRRNLAERFRAEFGLSPKLAGRVIRFERACRMLRAGRPAAEVAAACGYHDQSHLTRDFRAFAGCSPGEWLRTELPSVQDAAPLEPASSPT